MTIVEPNDENPNKATLMHKKIMAIDFDGTLCNEAFPGIGAPKVDIETGYTYLEKVIQAQKEGWYIILWTCRQDERLKDAVDWCAEHGLILDRVNENAPWILEAFGGDNRKIFAHVYIDDRALNVRDF